MSTARDYNYIIAKCEGIRAQLKKAQDESIAQAEQTKVRVAATEEAQAFLQLVAKETQEQFKIHIEDIVQLALDTMFPDQYEFNIAFSLHYGKTSAELNFISCKSGYAIDPMVASGGGVVDVCAFALRLACWTLSTDVDRVIVLDEPFRFLSQDLQERAGELLRMLSQRLGIQIIMTTHIAALIEASDRMIRVVKDADGVSQICYK